jgi:hypothetical protein
MKRTDADEHAGNLFQDENLPTTAGTLIEETWLNNVQEELCRAIELSGQDLAGGNYVQTYFAHNRFGPADFCRADHAALAGSWTPQLDPYGTFWVTQTAGLVGELEQGAAWVTLGDDRVFRVMLSTAQIAALNYDAYTFTASKDSYIAIAADGTLEVNETGLGAGEPAPSLGYHNILKVVTDGTDITSCEALRPAYPHLQCDAIDICGIPEATRKTGDSVGFRWHYTDATPDTVSLSFFNAGGIQGTGYVAEADAGGGSGMDQEWRGSFRWIPDGFTEPKREWRTHEGTTAEKTRYVDEKSFVYNHNSGASYVTAATYPLPHDGAAVHVEVSAIESGAATRTVVAWTLAHLQKASSAEWTVDGAVSDPAGSGLLIRVVTDGSDIIIEISGEVGKLWRCTGSVRITPMDITA